MIYKEIIPDKITIFFLFFCSKIVYLVYRGVLVSISQGGAGVPCPPFLVFLAPFLSRLPALPVVVVGGAQVYACDWVVGGGELVL